MATLPKIQSVNALSDNDFHLHALSILRRELGQEGLLRFLTMNQIAVRDYTAERHLWLEGVTMDDILRDLNKSSTGAHA